jgi:hypothetical protein
VLAIFKIFGAAKRSVSKIKKLFKNSKFYSFSEIFPKVLVQIVQFIACLPRLINDFEKKIICIR